MHDRVELMYRREGDHVRVKIESILPPLARVIALGE